jgi:hypothetical protein
LLLLTSQSDPQHNLQVQEIGKLIHNNTQRVLAIEQQINQKKCLVKKGFDREDGIFVKSLDNALSKFNVERQAYHGGSFIGNHIHRTLKVLI